MQAKLVHHKPKDEVEKKNNANKGLTAQAASDDGTTLHAEEATTLHDVHAYFDENPDALYEQGERANGEILGVVDMPDNYYDESIIVTSWNLYSFEDFFGGKGPLKTVPADYKLTASDPEYIILTPNVENVPSKHVKLWLNKAMTGFDKDVLIGEFDVYDGGYYYIAKTPLPDGVSDEGFDVLYYGDNPNLVNKEGVTLQGWKTEPDGLGEWVVTGESATLSDLNLGSRGEYSQDLQQLADLQTKESPEYQDDNVDTSASDKREAELEDKYTAHLYAQWETPAAQSTTQTTTRGQTPRTGDSQTMLQTAAFVVAAAAVSFIAAHRLRKD